MILLVAIIAAIALTLRERKDSKHMDPADQVRVQGARPPAHRQDAADACRAAARAGAAAAAAEAKA